jgi:hypothetical protein
MNKVLPASGLTVNGLIRALIGREVLGGFASHPGRGQERAERETGVPPPPDTSRLSRASTGRPVPPSLDSRETPRYASSKNAATVMNRIKHVSNLALVMTATAVYPTPGDAATPLPATRVTVQGDTVELHSPFFVFRLNVVDGLQADFWENHLTGRKLNLGGGPEVGFDLGLPGQPLTTPKLRVVQKPGPGTAPASQAVFELASDAPDLGVSITYRWDAQQPVLRKFVSITNRSGAAWDRLLNIRLGSYATDARSGDKDPDFPLYLTESHQGGALVAVGDPPGRVRGFPAYLEWQFFLGLAHPAGFATRQGGEVLLRQLPGLKLAPGASFECMEVVYGVSGAGGARQAFCDHLLGRMRRVRRAHDQPLAIFEPFGSKPDGDFWETEEFVLSNLAKVAEGRQQSGLRWDYYCLEFWHDPAGDLAGPSLKRFPRGFTRFVEELNRLKMKPGLWLDSGELGGWSIAANPAVKRSLTRQGGSLCRATAPINRFYIDGFTRQIRENGVRLLKFDNFLDRCDEPGHAHLPGDYSTEPICNAVIDCYQALDAACPELFLMLYWKYRSPWWLLHADTLFDVGTRIEAASFAAWPTLRARQSATRRLDQARWMVKDFPALGWDPLGVWLSDWDWNSRIGKEAWQDGVVMDLCRGHLLAQLWSDTPYLSPPERAQMADFISLLKARPDCFRHPRFILGNPWREEPYGYCCSDGRRTFIAINNGVWRERAFTLELNPAWGLPDGRQWHLYRWYPEPARLRGDGPVLPAKPTIALRPFEIALFEIVPAGEAPTLNRAFEERPLPTGFLEVTRALPLQIGRPDHPANGAAGVAWVVLGPTGMRSTGGAVLQKLPDGSLLASGPIPSPDTYHIEATTGLNSITAIRLEALPDDSLPQSGPGRAVNGNFTLVELSVSAAPRDNPTALQLVRLVQADADFSQTSHGGWPVAAAIDGNPRTGWGIHPREGTRHEAVFELERPVSFPRGAVLRFKLDQHEREHSLGRFRLSVTSARPPIPVAKSKGRFLLQGQVPATRSGGLLAVSVELRDGPQPYWTHDCRQGLAFAGKIGDKTADFQAVLNNGWYPAPWQTWRVAVSPSDKPQSFELHITSDLPPGVEHHFSAHFVPQR